MSARRTAVGMLLLSVLALFPMQKVSAAGELTIVEHDASRHPEMTLVVTGPSLSGAEGEVGAFEVTENGARVEAAVERIDAGLDVVLLVDTSGSMLRGALQAATGAASAFVDRLHAGSRVAVVNFGPAAQVILPFTTDRAAQRAALGSLVASGETPLYDGVVAASQLFTGSGSARRAIVVLSDGGDTVSASSLSLALQAASDAGAAVWAVSLQTTESDPVALDSLAGTTGGRVVAAEDPAGLDAAFRDVAGDLAVQYRISYRTKATGPTTVAVVAGDARVASEVSYPEQPGAAVQTGMTEPLGSADSRLLAVGAATFFLAMLIALIVLLVTRSRAVRLGDDAGRSVAARDGWAALASRVSAVAERTLERRGQRRGLEAALEQAGIQMRAGEAVVIALCATFGAGAVASLLGGWLLAPFGAAFALVACAQAVVQLRNRRRRRFADQVDDLLQMIGSSLRAGYGLVQAVELTSREMRAPAGDELRRLTTEVRLGRDLADALDGAAQRMANEDFAWAVQAIRIHHEVGGDLAAVLDRVAETIRARAHLRRQVSALSAEGRVSALILTVLPMGLLALMTVLNPSYVGYLFSTTAGLLLLAGAGVLLSMGAVWLRHLVRPVY